MSDDLQVAVVQNDGRVVVPDPATKVLLVDVLTPLVIESDKTQIVSIDQDVHVVDEVQQINIVSVGEQGPQGPQGPSGAAIITRTAAISIGGHRAVVLDNDELATYADNTDLTHADKVLGISTGAASAGAPVAVQTYGEMVEPSFSFVAGELVYVGSNGLLSQNSPTVGFSRAIGFALAPTKLFIDLSVPTVRA